MIVGGAGDQSGVMVVSRLMLEEEAFQEGKEFFGVLVLGGREI